MKVQRMLPSLFLILNALFINVAFAETASEDLNALMSLKTNIKNTPQNWEGSSDPCGGWDGIKCTKSRVISIKLLHMDLEGHLPQDIGSLSELQTLDLSYNKQLVGTLPLAIGDLKKLSEIYLVGCGFTGNIPEEIGLLSELTFLSLNSNKLNGGIPASIGNLAKLIWLDLTDNQLEGPIPVSSATTPGLNMLLNAEHFHLGKNKLSGNIPSKLFTAEMALLHLILDNNELTGSIPDTIGLVTNLTVVRVENNSLSGIVPVNLSLLGNVTDLGFSNNMLQGPLPNLKGMNNLKYLDMSNNSFDPSVFPSWLPTLQSLETLMMASTNLRGDIPVTIFSLDHLQTVVLEDNELSGTLDIGTNHSKQLQLINLRKNKIESFEEEDADSNITTILEENPVCYETGTKMKTFCTNSEMSEQQNKCGKCSNPDEFASPNMCKCSYPYTGTLYYRAPSYMNKSDLEQRILDKLRSSNLPVDSVLITSPCFQYQCLEFIIQIFPSDQDHFNLTITSQISLLLVYLSRNDAYTFFPADDDYGNEGFHKSYIGIIIGTTVGGSILLVLLLLAGFYAFSQKKRAEKAIEQSNPFGHWDQSDSNSTQPQLHGARRFSFAELKKYTQNFSEANEIGSGGYGKVYRGVLPNGRLVAIKRAEKQSKQGALEFKAEIELLSRVHHKNLVTLVGFCFEKGEQMLVYEFVPNGTLKDSISGKSGIVMNWTRRLKVTLGAARGLAYLHEHANPPIIHRDIKSTNILLDQYLHAKVADFGLSKPLDDCEKDHVTTQVKGTMGYMDPDYYTSQQLTEKSDVYSFGVLMLELITARKPIQGGKHIVKVVRNAINKTKDLYGLHEILDPSLDLQSISKGFEKFADLAMECVEESGANRPKMSDVVKEIESILKSSGLNPTPESSASNSACYEDTTRSENSGHPYNSTEFFDTSVVLLHQEKTQSK